MEGQPRRNKGKTSKKSVTDGGKAGLMQKGGRCRARCARGDDGYVLCLESDEPVETSSRRKENIGEGRKVT